MTRSVRRVVTTRAGRLIPAAGAGLRAGTVALRAGEAMGRHSTGSREELLIALSGWVRVETDGRAGRRRLRLARGQAVFLPQRTRHAVRNVSGARALYLYVTGRA